MIGTLYKINDDRRVAREHRQRAVLKQQGQMLLARRQRRRKFKIRLKQWKRELL